MKHIPNSVTYFYDGVVFVLGCVVSTFNITNLLFENVDHTATIGKVFTDLDLHPLSSGNTGTALNESESPDVCRTPFAVSTPRQPLWEVQNQELLSSLSLFVNHTIICCKLFIIRWSF